MKNFILISVISFSLSSCIPAVFTAATASTFATAKDRSFGDTIDDSVIHTKLKKEFMVRGFKKLYYKITPEVVQGRVLLTGELESDEDVISAVDIAWSISGVKEVINELKISENSNKFDAAQYTKDTWISGRIKAALFFNRTIKFVNYTVITQKNVVYLFGIARTDEELNEVTKIASEIAGVERVVSYVHMREESAKKLESVSDIDESSRIKSSKEDNLIN
jgi:osmotically-inducible protein OsmY